VFEKQRQIVALEIRTNSENERSFEEVIEKINTAMTISAICQEIGMQALFAAATMGAATYLAGTARMAAAGQWLAELGESNAVARTAVGAAAKVGGLSRSVTGAEALTGVLSRAASGVVILAFRRMTGDLGTQDPMNFKGIGAAIFLTVLIAWAGSPGAPRANITPLKYLVEKLPTFVSTQGAAQVFAVPAFVGVNAWIKDQQNQELVKYIKEHRDEFDKQIEKVADRSADAILDWATKAAQDVAKNVGREAGKIDYAKRLPFFARTFDFVGNAQTLRDMSIQAAVAGAETEFWIRVSHCFSDLEQAVRAGKQIGK